MQRLYEKTHFDMAYADIRMHNGESTFIKKASNPKFVSSRTYALDEVAVEIVKRVLVVAQPFYNMPPSLCCGD